MLHQVRLPAFYSDALWSPYPHIRRVSLERRTTWRRWPTGYWRPLRVLGCRWQVCAQWHWNYCTGCRRPKRKVQEANPGEGSSSVPGESAWNRLERWCESRVLGGKAGGRGRVGWSLHHVQGTGPGGAERQAMLSAMCWFPSRSSNERSCDVRLRVTGGTKRCRPGAEDDASQHIAPLLPVRHAAGK